jgi:hypothetical protein
MGILIFITCIVVFVFFIKKYKNYELAFCEKREAFIDYLYSINDIESLKKIGAINFMGVREDWIPKSTSLIPYLEKKIEETHDKNFENYLADYKQFIRNFMRTMPFIVLSIFIPLAYIIKLF